MNNDVLDSVLRAYKRQSLLSFMSIVLLVMGLITVIWFQTVSVISVGDLMDKFEGQRNEISLTFFLNLVTGAGMLIVGGVWVFTAFTNRRNYSYSYYDSDETGLSGLVYGFTGTILIGVSFIFLVYLFSKLSILAIGLLLVFLYVYSQGKK